MGEGGAAFRGALVGLGHGLPCGVQSVEDLNEVIAFLAKHGVGDDFELLGGGQQFERVEFVGLRRPFVLFALHPSPYEPNDRREKGAGEQHEAKPDLVVGLLVG